MRYQPKTRPVFPGDDWGELRDEQMEQANFILARIAGVVARHYQRSAIVLGREDDAVAVELRREHWFDARAGYVAYAHLAAVWRLRRRLLVDRLEGVTDLFPLIGEWQTWVLSEAGQWFLDNPRLLRLFALVLAKWQTRDTILHEMDLWDELKSFYPLPPPENLDFFDSPDGYTPYPNS